MYKDFDYYQRQYDNAEPEEATEECEHCGYSECQCARVDYMRGNNE